MIDDTDPPVYIQGYAEELLARLKSQTVSPIIDANSNPERLVEVKARLNELRRSTPERLDLSNLGRLFAGVGEDAIQRAFTEIRDECLSARASWEFLNDQSDRTFVRERLRAACARMNELQAELEAAFALSDMGSLRSWGIAAREAVDVEFAARLTASLVADGYPSTVGWIRRLDDAGEGIAAALTDTFPNVAGDLSPYGALQNIRSSIEAVSRKLEEAVAQGHLPRRWADHNAQLATLVWIKHFGNSETLSSDLPVKANYGQAFVAECLKALWADQSISDRSINRMIEVARNSIKSLIKEDEKAFRAFRRKYSRMRIGRAKARSRSSKIGSLRQRFRDSWLELEATHPKAVMAWPRPTAEERTTEEWLADYGRRTWPMRIRMRDLD